MSEVKPRRVRRKLRDRMGHTRYDDLSRGAGEAYEDGAKWVCWERKDGTLSEMHVLSEHLDGEGHPLTMCHALTRVVESGDIAWVYTQNEADSIARTQHIKRCPECFGGLAQRLWPDYREHKSVMKDQDREWELTEIEEKEHINLRTPPYRGGVSSGSSSAQTVVVIAGMGTQE